MDEKPKHGQIKNWREETRVEFEDYTVNGEQFRAVCFAETHPVSERYCATCQKWIVIRGIFEIMLGCPQCHRDW